MSSQYKDDLFQRWTCDELFQREPVAAVAIRNHRADQICRDLDHITSDLAARIGPSLRRHFVAAQRAGGFISSEDRS